jgi:hypothetical protein
MTQRSFGVADIEKLEEFSQQFVDELLAAIHVNMCWNAEF